MRRTVVLALAALALLGVLTPDAFAQAPTPTFKITGLIDQLTTYSRNVSNIDGNFNQNDKQWYGRTRGRFDFIGEVGKAKAVLGIELDMSYGQTGSNDSTIVNAGATATTPVRAQFGTDGSFDLNTDSRGIIEIKWLYTEFEAPLLPVPTVVRLGAQPFGSAANYKLATYANGDFPGLNIVSTITPNVKISFTYAQVEEALTGFQHGLGVTLDQLRGDDFALILAPEITVMKGVDIKPMYSYFYAGGTTSGNARQGRGGISASTPFTPPGSGSAWGINEDRHTVGIDSRIRIGAFSLDPTVLYQFGHRDVIVPVGFAAQGYTAGTRARADLDAWLIDLRAGYQLGPLLLEALYVFSTGNKDRDSTLGTVKYFQPITTDTSYLADWGPQLTALGLDYLNAWNEAGGRVAYPGVSIGWDKYGRHQMGARATYAFTPALSATFGANVHLTQYNINPDNTFVAGAGILPNYNSTRAGSNYVGTEFNLGATWRFAPGLAWDNAMGYMIMGDALDNTAGSVGRTGGVFGQGDAKDPFILTSRVRFTF
jgi:hypothetical protein